MSGNVWTEVMPKRNSYNDQVTVLVDGDPGFAGVNELTQPAQLPAGEAAEAVNCRFSNNGMVPRLGLAKLPWSNRTTATSQTALPFGQIYGGIDYRDPNGVEWTILAADGQVFRTRASNGAQPLALPAGVVINYPVTFEQCFNGLVMFRGETLPELILTSLDAGFTVMSLKDNLIHGAGTENPTDGTQPIPYAVRGDWIANRLFIPFSKDLLGISDYLNATRYAGVRSQARINQGTEDALVRFYKFNDQSGIAFKENSIYVLSGITGDLTAMAQDEITREYGLCGAETPKMVGNDVWFLANRRGVCSITQTVQNKLQGVDVPVSYHLKQTIDRINWDVAKTTACAAYNDNKYYLAIPLDDASAYGVNLLAGQTYNGTGQISLSLVPGEQYCWTPGANDGGLTSFGLAVDQGTFTATTGATTVAGTANAACTGSLRRQYSNVNNAVIVFDFLQQKWAGADTGPGLSVQRWVTQTYQGARRLFALSNDGFINLYEEMPYDEAASEQLGAAVTISGNFGPDGIYYVAVETGRRYVYGVLINNGYTAVNGTQRFTAATVFIAQTNQLALTGGTPSAAVAGVTLNQVDTTIQAAWIQQDFTTRGYTCGTLERKRFLRATLEVLTWYPEFSIYAVVEGVSEQVALVVNRTKSFLHYSRPFDAPNWVQTNVNNDHATPWRDDYAIVLSDATVANNGIQAGVQYFAEDLQNPTQIGKLSYNGQNLTPPVLFTGVAGAANWADTGLGTIKVYAPGAYFNPGSGADPDAEQEFMTKVRFTLKCRGKQVQLRITSAQGRISVLSTGIEAVEQEQFMGDKA